MRTLILLVLLATPLLNIASSLEDSFFVGISSHGKLLRINVRSDYDGGALPYGSTDDPTFHYCENVEFLFQCAKTPKEMPTVIYKSGNHQRDNDDHTKGTGIRYKEAMDYLKKVMASFENKSAVEFNNYYYCEKGCDDKKPLFIFAFDNKYEDP